MNEVAYNNTWGKAAPSKDEYETELMVNTSKKVAAQKGDVADPIKPAHYDGRKCMEIITDMVKDKSPDEAFIIGNVVKYLYRYNRKKGVEDVKKAGEYITMLVEILEKK